MKQITIQVMVLVSCWFLLAVPDISAQVSYKFDLNGDQLFDSMFVLPSIGSTVQVDIWLDNYTCLPSDLLLGAQFYLRYNPYVVQVNDAYPNDSDHGGPFDPALSEFSPTIEDGVYSCLTGKVGFVTVVDNKVKLGTFILERIASGDTPINAANDVGGPYNDGFISDCNITNQYPADATAALTTISFCEGLADYDEDVDGTDAFMFKQHFGRSTLGNPCPPDGPAPVPKTGQTKFHAIGDDGALERGVIWPNQRFTDNGNGTVTDNLTGLIWLKNANCFGERTWQQAIDDCNNLSAGWCGLLDGSSSGDWRLPNVRELHSIIDYGKFDPALPSEHLFTNVQSTYYWSSTTHPSSPHGAWAITLEDGYLGDDLKTYTRHVLPVRAGH